MIVEQPDPPITLQEAAEKFSQFLCLNGYPSRIRWIEADQILLGNDRQHFIRVEGAQDALAEARRRYDVGLKRDLGILLQAICAAPHETIANVYAPCDVTDAQYRWIRPALKLSCPTTLTPATMVEDLIEWKRIELENRLRTEMLRETYDL